MQRMPKLTPEEEKRAAQVWRWEVDGPRNRAKLEIVLGGKVIKEYPWSKWVKFPTPVEYGYWK